MKKHFTLGCRVVTPIGMQGTVIRVSKDYCVVQYDNGEKYFGFMDKLDARRIATEDEAKTTLEWYGKHQPQENARCLRCGRMLFGTIENYYTSCRVNAVICCDCDEEEGRELITREFLPFTKWAACVVPQYDGIPWKR